MIHSLEHFTRTYTKGKYWIFGGISSLQGGVGDLLGCRSSIHAAKKLIIEENKKRGKSDCFKELGWWYILNITNGEIVLRRKIHCIKNSQKMG